MKPREARTSSQAPGGGFAPPFGANLGEAIDGYLVPYDQDPRIKDAGSVQDGAAQRNQRPGGPMDYVELQCETGEPDVDLSYWKEISQDK